MGGLASVSAILSGLDGPVEQDHEQHADDSAGRDGLQEAQGVCGNRCDKNAATLADDDVEQHAQDDEQQHHLNNAPTQSYNLFKHGHV